MDDVLDRIGWFDSGDQAEPSYDPPHDGPCIVCDRALVAPMKTVSIRAEGSKRSFFYRAHAACYAHDELGASKKAFTLIRSIQLDAVLAAA